MAAAGSQCSGIPLNLLRRCRAVISRRTDDSGRAVWLAELPDLPSCRATGSSRIEALDRVRELAERGGGGDRRRERRDGLRGQYALRSL